MIVVADASVLVAELIRERGRALLRDPRVRMVITEEQWGETQHELNRRLQRFTSQSRAPADEIALIRHDIEAVIDGNAIEVVPRHAYGELETIARRRVPRDPRDWPAVALALALNAGILTNDDDFFGCGCATWTMETLPLELKHRLHEHPG